MAEKDKGTDSRLKLTITEVGARQSVGDKGAVKLLFYARATEAAKALPYFTFSSRLFETIEGGKGKEIDCDVNVSQRTWDRDGDIQIFTDRKVTQIYVDGQPLGGKRFGGGYQDSPEKMASIENQKRADITAQLWIAGKFDEKTPEVKKMRAWLMGGDVPAKTPEPKPTRKPEPADSPFPDETSPDAPTAEKATPAEGTATDDLKSLPMANLGNLFSSCLHYFKMNQSDVLKELGGITKEQIADPQEAWAQIVEAKS